MLERIVAAKRQEVQELKRSLDTSGVSRNGAALAPGPFLRRDDKRVAVIAEVKQASPVKGTLCADFDPLVLAASYQQNGAGAISVISDQPFFQGSKDYLPLVKAAVTLPVLRKDFIVDEIQLYESLMLQADLVLLIAALHDYGSLLRLSEKSLELGLAVLMEVHERAELEMVLDLPVPIIGINNRNLRDFSIKLATSLQLVDLLPDKVIKVSESGISSPADMLTLERAGFHAALIGEALVSAKNPGQKLQEIIAYRREVERDDHG